MRRSRSALDASFYVAGQHVPRVTGALVVTLLVLTIVAANARALFAAMALAPARVLGAAEVWRLVTWPFVEPPSDIWVLSLVFSCLGLFWFSRDLVSAWGGARFLVVFFSLAAAAAALTCAVSLAWTRLQAAAYLGPWPMIDALIIAWAVLFPGRQILVWFVLPLRGQTLIYAVVGGTVLAALLQGLANFIPHFMAELAVLTWLKFPQWRAQVAVRMARRRRPSHLKTVSGWGEKPRWYH